MEGFFRQPTSRLWQTVVWLRNMHDIAWLGCTWQVAWLGCTWQDFLHGWVARGRNVYMAGLHMAGFFASCMLHVACCMLHVAWLVARGRIFCKLTRIRSKQQPRSPSRQSGPAAPTTPPFHQSSWANFSGALFYLLTHFFKEIKNLIKEIQRLRAPLVRGLCEVSWHNVDIKKSSRRRWQLAAFSEFSL